MQFNTRMIGAGVAAAVGAGLGYLMLARREAAAGFAMVTRDGRFSVRDYPRLVVAETWVQGMRDSALARGLAEIADYVLGSDRRARISGPVLADGDADGRGWRTRFVLPARIRPEMLPAPAGEVQLRSVPARRLATLRYMGENDEQALDTREAELRDWIDRRGLRVDGPVEHAFYSSPLTPAALRRNEVRIPLAA